MDLDNKKNAQPINLTEEEIIDAYLNQLDVDTPDLWDRIETGIDAYENKNIEHIEQVAQKNKKRKHNYVAWITTAVSLAAVILAAILVIPYLTGNQRNMSDVETNKHSITNQAGKSDYDAVANEGYYQADEAENVQENYASDSVYEDTNAGLTQAQDQTNGSDVLTEEVVDSVGNDMVIGEQNILCTLKVLYVADAVYHCEIAFIDENPFDLSSGLEIDVICEQEDFQMPQDTAVEVKLLGKQEDGYYVVVEK